MAPSHPVHRRPLAYGITTAVLAALLGAPAAAAPHPGPQSGKQRVIVELDRAAALQAAPGPMRSARAADVKAERRQVAAAQRSLLDAAEGKGVEPKAVRKLGLLLNAVAMTVDSAADVATLRALPGVKSVRPDAKIRVLDTDAQQLTGVPDVWKRDAPDGSKATGKGTTVAVVDTGIDYTHPDLGGGFGAGHKVVAGHDFVNNDDDPMDDHLHGTHVAGTIAGKAVSDQPDKGVTGAAPDAELTAYKVMDAEGRGDTSAVIAGIEAAADPANPHRADVINLSIGGPGDGLDPLGLAATAAVDAGVVVVAAAGNEGPGPYTVGSPAAARGVLAVGASTSGIRVPELRHEGAKLDTYRGVASANPPAGAVSGKVVSIGAGTAEDWEKAGDVKGKFVLYAFPPATTPEDLRGDDQLVYQEAEKRGALALIGGVGGGGGPVTAQAPPQEQQASPVARIPADADVTPQASGDEYRMDRLPILGVDRFQGEDLAAMAGTDAKVTLSARDSTDEIAAFSSRGPDAGLGMKPDIVAPGVEIRSTVPKSRYPSGIKRLSGTSMATPLVAASAALLRQLHPDRTAADTTAALIGSAKHLKGVDRLAQGAGRLDVPAAADAALTAAPATVSFRLPHMDERTVSGTRTVTLHNPGDKQITGSTSASGTGATVSPRHVTVPAHGTAKVQLRIRADRPKGRTVHFTGAITVSPTGGKDTPTLTVPYLLDSAPLYIDATPDPTTGPTDVYVYTPTPLKSPPTLTIDPPHGRPYEVKTQATGDPRHYVAPAVKGERAGTYRVTAKATTAAGKRQYGEGGFAVAAPGGDKGKWQPIGPNSSSGELTRAPSAGDQAVISQYGVAGGWLTTDRGKSWKQQSHTPFMGVGVKGSSIVIDKDDPTRWWSTVAASNWTVGSGGIMRTDDNGRTWQRLNAPDLTYDGLVASRDTKVLVTEANGTPYVSRDAGDTWTAEDLGLPGEAADIAFGGDDLYLWSGQSIWVVRDMSSGTPQPAEKIYTADPASRLGGFDADDGLVAVKVQGKAAGVHVSSDGGRSWNAPHGSSWGTVQVADGGVYFEPPGDDAEISEDGGKTWTKVKKQNSSAVTIDYDRWQDGSYTVSSSSGTYRPKAGGGYDRLGVQGGSIPALAATEGALLAGTDNGTYRTGLPARSPEWGQGEFEGSTGTATPQIEAYAKDPKIVWRAFESLRGLTLQRSDDAGKTWEDRGQLDGLATSLMVDPRDPDKVAVGYRRPDAVGIYTTTDGGADWKSHIQRDYMQALAADPADPGRLWVGGLNGLYYSDDFGATLHKRADTEVRAIGFAGSRMIIGGAGLHYSTDGGRTLHRADTGGLRVQVSDVVRADGAWYAGTTTRWMPGEPPHGGRGVLRSTDNGRTWQNVSVGLQNTDVLSLAAAEGSLYAGTEYGGVHRLRLED
ncbi:S8 family serine peptidase [Streptomyces boninensis]|uniref:S8 family serine peptidase n=1 Tax=Streptomyces boninensis TaxID=2039455 RepID=UPI003B221029